jgi:4a-hydroxytetrahydrobiopterin dehydratase
MPRLLTSDEVDAQLRDLPNWKAGEQDGESAIETSFELTDFVAALDLVNRIGHLAEQMNHHPDIDIRWNTVRLVLSTHSEGGLTQLDIEAAHRINDEAGLDLLSEEEEEEEPENSPG